MKMNPFSSSPCPVVVDMTNGSVKRPMTNVVDLSQDEFTSRSHNLGNHHGSVKRSRTDFVDLSTDEVKSSSCRKGKRNKHVSENFNPTSFDTGIKELINCRGNNFKPKMFTMRSRSMSSKLQVSSYLHNIKFKRTKVHDFILVFSKVITCIELTFTLLHDFETECADKET